MSLSNGPNIGVLENANDGEAHAAAFRAMLRAFDFFGMPIVKGVGTNTPPGSPANGDAYIVGTSPTGAWAGKSNNVARYSTVAVAWEFFTPKQGWKVFDASTTAGVIYGFNGTAWTSLQTFTQGINLGGTANLTAYDEGTWTPTLTNLGGTGITYATKWTKIGNRVDFNIVVTGSNLTATAGSTKISLPFTPARESACSLTDTSLTQGRCAQSYIDGNVYLPTITAVSKIDVTGTFFLN